MRYSADRLAGWQRHAPAITSAGLGLLIALELMKVASILLHGASSPPIAVPLASRAPMRAPGVDTERIVNAHLFGISAAEVSEDPNHAPPTTASLTLVGTIATTDPKKGMAIIGSSTEFHVYSVGQRVETASLRLVYADHVILERDGSLESLALPHAQQNASLRQTPPVHRSLSAASISQAAAQAATPLIDKIADSDSETDSAGKWLGIRVTAGKDTAAFNQSGLRSGDVIVAIDGNKLEDSERSQQMFKELATGATVTVLRWGGKTQDVTLNLAP